MPHHKRNNGYDSLRALMVLFIVLLHACCAYAMGIPWWHAQDTKAVPFDVTILVIDNFALPVLFFIAGLFAHTSLERHGTAGFIRAKIKRLGLPVLVLATLHLPAMVYVGYLRRTPEPLSFFQYWLRWMGSLGRWDCTVITTMEEGAPYADLCSPHHLWFLSLLLLFFLAYACCRPVHLLRIKNGLGWAALVAILGIALGFTGLNLLVQDWAWTRIGPFFLVQTTRVPVYLGMFLLGTAAAPRLGRASPFPGPWWGWLLAFAVSQAAMLAMVQTFIMTPGPAPLRLALAHGILRAAMAVTATGFFVNGATRLSTPGRWQESLAASSYDIYIWHMPLVVFAQAFLAQLPLPLAVKATAAFLLPTLALWLLSRGAKKQGLWIWAAYLGAVFLGFSLFTA